MKCKQSNQVVAGGRIRAGQPVYFTGEYQWTGRPRWMPKWIWRVARLFMRNAERLPVVKELDEFPAFTQHVIRSLMEEDRGRGE